MKNSPKNSNQPTTETMLDETVWTIASKLPLFKPLDADKKKNIIGTIQQAHFGKTQIQRLKNHDRNWFICDNDVTINSSFALDIPLIVTGDLTIKGVFDDSIIENTIANLIVLGKFEAEHVICRHFFQLLMGLLSKVFSTIFLMRMRQRLQRLVSKLIVRYGLMIKKKNCLVVLTI